MAVDVLFTDGIIAAKEKYLLKDKILRMCELGADDAFRMLIESGFGGGEALSVYEYDKLITADERSIDDFIREYAPSAAAKEYLLSPRDFHNAKALVKAEYLGADPENMLAPDGLVSVDEMKECFRSGDFSALNTDLANAIIGAREYLQTGDSGAEVGSIFEKALSARLFVACKRNRTLKKLIAARADMTNILTAVRSADALSAEKNFVSGGRLGGDKLSKLFEQEESALRAFEGTEYLSFVKMCLAAKSQGKPLTDAEKRRDSFDCDYLAANRFELKKSEPFLYYVFRRRTENENVRIVFVCLLSGMAERDIKNRLRGF